MSVIVISSDSYQKGQEIAQACAQKLGYRRLGREILKTVAATHHIAEEKLVKTLEEVPSFLGMSARIKNRCLAYIQEAVLGQLLDDGVICFGLAAHLYVLGIAHVLKVRVLADPEARLREMAAQMNVSVDKAAKLLKKKDKLRKRWSLEMFKVDETDPAGYDLVVSLSQIDPAKAVQIITDMVSYRKFRPMTYSIKCLQDKALASRVRAVLLEHFPDVRVDANGRTVVVETGGLKREKRKKTAAIKELAEKIPGVGYVEVHIINDIFRQAVESFR